MDEKKYTAKINGRGKLKLYKDIPKFFCVFYIEGIGEKKSMITVSNYDINDWGYLITNDPISKISKGDTVDFYIENINTEWLNLKSSNIEVIDDSGSKEWERNRKIFKIQKEEQCRAELEREREKHRIKKEEQDRERKELYKKYQQWYLKEYDSKTTGASILLMNKTLNQIKHEYSLIGIRGKRGLYTGDSWNVPTGLHANVFHGLNQNIVNKVSKELIEKKFAKYRLYKVITHDPKTQIETESRQKGIRITEKGKMFLINFEKRGK